LQITELSSPQLAPNGYESILSVKLDQPLKPEKAYEVGFWIIGRQLKDRGYSYPINVFPSNSIASVDEQVFNQVESSAEVLPVLEVLPPPSYSGRGHFTFIIRPHSDYNYVTIALKNRDASLSTINFRKKQENTNKVLLN